jgi:hypothetical protein
MPYSDLRFYALKCLGLLCVSSIPYSRTYLNLLIEIVNTTQEEEAIRSQALESLADLIRIHTTQNLLCTSLSPRQGGGGHDTLECQIVTHNWLSESLTR